MYKSTTIEIMSGLVSKWATDESLVQEALKQDSKHDDHKHNSLEDSKWNKPITSKASEPLVSKWANADDDDDNDEEKAEVVEDKHATTRPKGPRAPPRTPKKNHRSSYPTPPSSAEIDSANPLALRLDMLNLGKDLGSRPAEKRRADRDHHRHHERGTESIREKNHSHRGEHRHNHRDEHRHSHRPRHSHNTNKPHDHAKQQLKQELDEEQEEEEEEEEDEERQKELLKQFEEWESQHIDWADIED